MACYALFSCAFNSYSQGVYFFNRFLMELILKKYFTATGLCLPLLMTALLSACGGGSGGTTPTTTTPNTTSSITSVTPDTLMYGKKVRFTVVGVGLDKGLNMTSTSCANIDVLISDSTTQRTITCTPTANGTVQLSLTLTGVAAPFISNQVVPLPQVTMKTTMGDMVLELYPANAPLTVNNFLQYVNDGFYTNLIFHRVISTFVVQGGGYTTSVQLAPTRAAIKLESANGLSNLRGTIAMARTGVPDSATSQFFLNVVDNTFLNGNTAGVDGYAVFGKVVTGLTVMDAIKVVPTTSMNGLTDVPTTAIIITGVTQTQ